MIANLREKPDKDYSFLPLDRRYNEAILRLLEEVPVGDKIRLIVTARPDYFHALSRSGESYDVLGVKNQEDRLGGFASLSIQKRFLGGRIISIGYLSHLRIDPSFRGNGLVSQGISYLKELSISRDIPHLLMAIPFDNQKMLQIFAGGRSNYPSFQDLGKINSKLIPTAHRPDLPTKLGITMLSGDEIDSELLDRFFSEEAPKKDFYPSFEGSWNYDLPKSDTLVALKGESIVGALTMWNQQGFKQVLVKRYPFLLRKFRFLWPALPPENFRLNFALICRVAVKGNDPDILESMLRRTQSKFAGRFSFLACGFHENDALSATLLRIRGISYHTKLLFGSWKPPAENLVLRTIYPEIALL